MLIIMQLTCSIARFVVRLIRLTSSAQFRLLYLTHLRWSQDTLIAQNYAPQSI